MLLFMMALAYFSLTWNRTLELRDEGYMLYRSVRFLAGEVPHRDSSDIYGPGVFPLTAVALWLFDGEILGVRGLVVIFKAMAVVVTFLLARRAATRPFAIFGALLGIAYWGRASWNLNTPYAGLYTIPICMLAVFLLTRAFRRPSSLGYATAGLVGGAAILFKQSLALANGFGMALAICAVTLLEAQPDERRGAKTWFILIPWFLAAIAPGLAFATQMGLRDYVLHFLPFQLFMMLVAVTVVRRGSCTPILRLIWNRLWPLVSGLGVIPAVVVLFYGWWGSLGELIFNMFLFPGTLVNYYMPAPLPPLSLSIFLAGAAGLVIAGLFGIRRKTTAAAILGASMIVLMLGARWLIPVREVQTVFDTHDVIGSDFYTLATMWRVSAFLDGVQAPAIFMLALAVLGLSVFRREESRGRDALRIFIPLMSFQAMMAFQVFPRASYNIWQIQGASMPLLAVALYRCYLLGVGREPSFPGKALAATLVAILPLWMVAPVVQATAQATSLPGYARTGERELSLPGTNGIRLSTADVQLGRIDQAELLVRYLRGIPSRSSPVFMLTNDVMVLFLSGRETLFPDRQLPLYLLGWGMLPEAQIRELDTDAMIRRLQETPEAIVVDRADEYSARIGKALPELRRFISEHYENVATIRGYRILRQKRS